MTFEIKELPSGGILIKGQLIQKKLAAKAKRQVVFCFPSTVEDIAFLQSALALPVQPTDDTMEVDLTLYGHLALCCIADAPLLVIGTHARQFIHFSQVRALYDEEDLQSACSFSLMTSNNEFRFYSDNSTDYQKWIGAFTRAFEAMDRSVREGPFDPPSDVQSNPYSPNVVSDLSSERNRGLQRASSRASLALSMNPDDYLDAHHQLVKNRPPSVYDRRMSFSSSRPDRFGAAAQSVGFIAKLQKLVGAKNRPSPDESRSPLPGSAVPSSTASIRDLPIEDQQPNSFGVSVKQKTRRFFAFLRGEF